METWEGTAELTGYGAAKSESYPARWAKEHASTGERVEFEMTEPAMVPGPLDSTMYMQEIKIRVTTSDSMRARDLAMKTVLKQTDAISFATDRRVQVSLSLLSKVTSQSDDPDARTVLYMRRWKGPQEPLAFIYVDILAHMEEQIGSYDNDRGLRILRALSWLRRASLADDEVEEFSILAMGMEALVSFLPRPPAKSGNKKKKGKGNKPVEKPGTSEILRHWALKECGITQENWKRVGRLRHSLFHGGITENTETRAELATASLHLRFALGLALKHVLNLPSDAAPHLSLPPFAVTDLHITAPPFTPASDLDTRAHDNQEPGSSSTS